MREICRDVPTEPTLLPINENDHSMKEKSTLLTMQCECWYLCVRTV